MAIYNLGVQVYAYYNASTRDWTHNISNLKKSIEYFVTKDMYNYIDSHFKERKPFLINEVGNKTTIIFAAGHSTEGTGIIIEKTGHYIDNSKVVLKCIVESSYSDGRPKEYDETEVYDWFEPNTDLNFYLTVKDRWTVKIPKEVPIYESDFDWVAWATKEKLKLENYGKGKEYLFFDTSDKSKILGEGAILGASMAFTVGSKKYTLDDIINGTLNSQTLGKTFSSGMSYCNGIIFKYGGFLAPILRNKVFKIIVGAVSPEFIGKVWATYEIISLIGRYIPDGSSNWDRLQEQYKDMGYAVSGTDGMLTLGYTAAGQQIVDNWENSSYTGSGGATAKGASEKGTDIMEGSNDIAGAIRNGLKSQAQSIVDVLKNLDISLTIPQGASVPLTFDTAALKTFFDTLKIPFDTLALEDIIATGIGFDTTALKEYFDTVKVPFDTLSLEKILASGIGVKIPAGLTLPISGLRDIKVTGIKDIAVTGIRDIIATIENPVLSLEEAAMADLTKLAELFGVHSEGIKAYNDSKALRDAERWEKEKQLIDNDITNKDKKNAILTQEHTQWTIKSEGLTKVERDIKAWENEHSQVEYTTKEGVVLKKGLKANPQLSQQKTYNDTQLSEGKIRGKDKFVKELLPTLKSIIPETTEGTIKRFADVNPSMRDDFYEVVKSMFISGVK